MTQLEKARSGEITTEIEKVALKENLDVEDLRELVSTGRVVIPANKNHKNLDPIGIGKYLKTKINANIGTSGDFYDVKDEIKKLEMAVKFKADTIMDLSTGGDITGIRRELIRSSSIPFGNVPVYQMVIDILKRKKTFVEMAPVEMLEFIEEQAEDGVDYMTIHSGLTQKAVDRVKKQGRIAGIVSRGGSLTVGWMLHNKKENPFYEYFDEILKIANKHDVTLSLGDGLRPGAIADGTDQGQIEELLTLGELVKRSREAGVQVMVEGPGHIPLKDIEMNIRLQKSICDEAPFYVLGPIVTDIAPGYDHITSAIGGAIAASAGADFLCYVTPAEHLGLPDEKDVREGIIASKIAAHVGDISKGVKGSIDKDIKMGKARKDLNWEEQRNICLDPVKFNKVRNERGTNTEACSMCGNLCVYKVLDNF
ncbi:MAG: phosphomethylpyrimidine synthase ThiC [Acidobacteriota bacterium]